MKKCLGHKKGYIKVVQTGDFHNNNGIDNSVSLLHITEIVIKFKIIIKQNKQHAV